MSALSDASGPWSATTGRSGGHRSTGSAAESGNTKIPRAIFAFGLRSLWASCAT